MQTRVVAVVMVCVSSILLWSVTAGSQSAGTKTRSASAGAAIVLGLAPAAGLPSLPASDAATDLEAPYWAIDPGTGAHYRRDRVVLRFHDGVSSTLRAHALTVAGTRSQTGALWDGWQVADVPPDASAREVAVRLADDPSVADVTLDFRAEPSATRPNDEFYGLQWNLDAIDLPRAWDINDGASDDVVVAVVDSGLNTVGGVFTYTSAIVGRFSLPFAEAADLVAPGRIVAPRDFVYGDELPLDVTGHGTHVAGTIAQLTGNAQGMAGIAHKVRLMPVKVLGGTLDTVVNPSHMGGASSTIAAGIRHAADQGARVINLSLGGSGAMPLVRDAIQYAVSRGAFVAIASGNHGDLGNPTEYPAAYAADIRGAMAVGAVGRDLRRASYSGFKPYVEICAPGGDGTRNEADADRGVSQMTYRAQHSLARLDPLSMALAISIGLRPRFDTFFVTSMQGTSMAAPHVSGVAALLYSQGLTNPAAIEDAIRTFARPIDAREEECGAGLLDPRRALRGRSPRY